MIVLSILIPTLPERAHLLQRVISLIGNYPEVEILTDSRGREVTTGEKRNALIDRAQGIYTMFQDDDDWPQKDMVNHILTQIQLNPGVDCVTYEGWMETDGKNRVDWIIKHGERYEARMGADGITRYYRWPNHLVPMKKTIAQAVKFEHIWQGEDFRWSKQINDLKLIKTSVHIPIKLYFYDFRSRK